MFNESKFTAIILLVGTLFSAVGWLVTHTVSNLLSGPILEYGVEVLVHDPQCNKIEKNSSISVKSKNLSREVTFHSINFILRLGTSKNSKFILGDIVYQQPAYSSRDPILVTNKAIRFPNISIRPGTELRIIGCYIGSDQPTFHIGPGSNLRPVESGIQTWLARNEFGLLLTLLGFWCIFVIAVWCIIRKSTSEKSNGK